MTTIHRITDTGLNYIVQVRTSAPVIFYGWNDTVIKSVTPMPDGSYILDGRHDNGFFLPRANVGEIVEAFEKMARPLPQSVEL